MTMICTMFDQPAGPARRASDAASTYPRELKVGERVARTRSTRPRVGFRSATRGSGPPRWLASCSPTPTLGPFAATGAGTPGRGGLVGDLWMSRRRDHDPDDVLGVVHEVEDPAS